VIIISVFTTSIKHSRAVNELINEMALNIPKIAFYDVTLSTTSILVGENPVIPNDEKVLPSTKVGVVSEYGRFAHPYPRMTSVANRIIQR